MHYLAIRSKLFRRVSEHLFCGLPTIWYTNNENHVIDAIAVVPICTAL